MFVLNVFFCTVGMVASLFLLIYKYVKNGCARICLYTALLMMYTLMLACQPSSNLLLFSLQYFILHELFSLKSALVCTYWMTLLTLSFAILEATKKHRTCGKDIKNAKPLNNLLRKSFHFLIVSIIVPPYFFHFRFLQHALSLMISVFVCVEALRWAVILPRVSSLINQYIEPVLKKEESKGSLIYSHISLLIGVSWPILIQE